MASKPKTPKPFVEAPRELFEANPLPISIGAGGKFVGSINARETDDGVVLEQTNRRGTVKVLEKLDYYTAVSLGTYLIAAGRRNFI